MFTLKLMVEMQKMVSITFSDYLAVISLLLSLMMNVLSALQWLAAPWQWRSHLKEMDHQLAT
jgi:hypothetical protein